MNLTTKRLWIPALLFGAFALAPLLANAFGAGHWVSLLTRIMILAIATLSLDLVLGVGGMVSFGHAAFVGIGAYMAGILIQEGFGDLLIALPVTVICCALYGAFSGAISLRTRGVAFIMITLAFGQMAYFFAQALYRYGGDDGMSLSGRLTLAGFPIFENRMAFYYIVLAVLAFCYWLVSAIAASRFGRALLAARDNEVRAASLGYDVFRIRLTAFIISGVLAGVAGLLLANHTEFVSPAYIAWQRSGEFIFMAIIGGLGSLWGAIVGTAAFILIEEGLSGLTENWKAIFGPLVILFVLFTHGGISGLADRIFGPRQDGGGGHG